MGTIARMRGLLSLHGWYNVLTNWFDSRRWGLGLPATDGNRYVLRMIPWVGSAFKRGHVMIQQHHGACFQDGEPGYDDEALGIEKEIVHG